MKVIKINVKEKVQEVCKLLDEMDSYIETLQDSLNNVNYRICDLEHLIEYNKLKTNQCYRVIQELHRLRLERRRIKNDIELTNAYKQFQNRLIETNNRSILLNVLGKTEKSLLTSKYNNRVYTEEEIQKLIGA